MSENRYIDMLSSLDSVHTYHRTLKRIFTRFGHTALMLATDKELDFIDGLTVELTDQPSEKVGAELSPMSSFRVGFADKLYEFEFSTVPAGPKELVRGQISVQALQPFAHCFVIIFDRDANVVDGPALEYEVKSSLGHGLYCKALITQLLYDDIVAVE